MSTTISGTDPKMIANNLTSACPTHPCEILKDEIEHRGYRSVNWLGRWD